MAVEKRKLSDGTIRYRAYWRNPYTSKREYGPWETSGEAGKLSDEMKFKIKHEREYFLPEDELRRRTGLAVIDLLAAYHSTAPMTESTRESTFYHLKSAIDFFQQDLITDLSSKRMKEFENHLRAKGLKQNGINRKVGIITAALTWAKEQEVIDEVPFHKSDYRCKRGKDKKEAPLTPSEIEAVLAAASPHIKRAIYINFLTGARTGPSELLSLKWESFYFKELFIRINSAAKNDDIQWRDVPVSDPNAWEIFRQWKKEDDALNIEYVITWKGKPIKKFRDAWRRTLKRAGIKRYVRPYSLRHTFVTELLKAGADLKTASELAGHSDISTTVRIYQHTTEEMRKLTAQKLPKISLEE